MVNPTVVILRATAREDLSVDLTPATQHAALDEGQLAAVQVGLRNCLIVPGQAAIKELEKPCRSMDVGIGIFGAGLQQQHLCLRIGA